MSIGWYLLPHYILSVQLTSRRFPWKALPTLVGLKGLRGVVFAVQLNIEAYLLWEKAGRPEGADFSTEARRTLEEHLQSGKTLQDIENMLKAPPPPAPESSAAPPPSSTNGSGGNGNGAGSLYCPQP